MRTAFVAVMCSAVTGFWAPPALAQQKEKACQADWQANKAIYQPKGYTEQEYIDECRSFRTATSATTEVEPAHTRARPTATPSSTRNSSRPRKEPPRLSQAETVEQPCLCPAVPTAAARGFDLPLRQQVADLAAPTRTPVSGPKRTAPPAPAGPDEFPTEAQEVPVDRAFFEYVGAAFRIPAILVAQIMIVPRDLRGPNAEAKPFEQAFDQNGSSGMGESNCACASALTDQNRPARLQRHSLTRSGARPR
jgi:hypothetical protein